MRILNKSAGKGFSKTICNLRISNYNGYYFAIALAGKVLYSDVNDLSLNLLNK